MFIILERLPMIYLSILAKDVIHLVTHTKSTIDIFVQFLLGEDSDRYGSKICMLDFDLEVIYVVVRDWLSRVCKHFLITFLFNDLLFLVKRIIFLKGLFIFLKSQFEWYTMFLQNGHSLFLLGQLVDMQFYDLVSQFFTILTKIQKFFFHRREDFLQFIEVALYL